MWVTCGFQLVFPLVDENDPTRDAQPRIRVTYSGCGRHAANARLAVLTLSERPARQRA